MKQYVTQISLLSSIIAISSALILFSCNGKTSADEKKTISTENKEATEKADQSGESVLSLTASNFDETISSGVVLVDFWATWCKPCRTQAPVIEEIQKEMSAKIKVGKIDIDKSPDIADRFGIESIPTMIIFKDGKLAEQFVGITAKEKLTEAINKQLN